MGSYRIVGVAVVAWFASSAVLWAATCAVPSGGYSTIQAAVDDPVCTQIDLQSQVYQEEVTIGRSLTVAGVSSSTTIIVGRVEIEGGSSVVAMSDLTVDASTAAVSGCFKDAVLASGGARFLGSNVSVLNANGIACVLFSDGFEGGNTAAWSSATP